MNLSAKKTNNLNISLFDKDDLTRDGIDLNYFQSLTLLEKRFRIAIAKLNFLINTGVDNDKLVEPDEEFINILDECIDLITSYKPNYPYTVNDRNRHIWQIADQWTNAIGKIILTVDLLKSNEVKNRQETIQRIINTLELLLNLKKVRGTSVLFTES